MLLLRKYSFNIQTTKGKVLRVQERIGSLDFHHATQKISKVFREQVSW